MNALPYVFATIMAILTACGDNTESSSREVTSVSFRVMPSMDASLNLVSVAPTDFTIKVLNCTSGYSATVTSTTGTKQQNLYLQDTGCEAQLESFEYDSRVWTKVGGERYFGNSPGEFLNSTDNQRLVVVNPQQLPDPITSGSNVSFVFEEILPGHDMQLLLVSSGSGIDGDSGEKAPTMNVATPDGASLSNINETNIATFQFKLECDSTITDGTPAGASTCPTSGNPHRLDEMRALLVDDIYSGTLANNAAAAALFATPPSGATVITIGDDDVLASSDLFNGGFTFSTNTPSDVVSCRSYLLIIKRAQATDANSSYVYFNIDWVTSSTEC